MNIWRMTWWHVCSYSNLNIFLHGYTYILYVIIYLCTMQITQNNIIPLYICHIHCVIYATYIWDVWFPLVVLVVNIYKCHISNLHSRSYQSHLMLMVFFLSFFKFIFEIWTQRLNGDICFWICAHHMSSFDTNIFIYTYRNYSYIQYVLYVGYTEGLYMGIYSMFNILHLWITFHLVWFFITLLHSYVSS